MANDCCFDIRLKGQKDDVLELYDWLRAYYCYSEWDRDTGQWKELPEPKVGILEPAYAREGEEQKFTPTRHHIGYRIFHCESYDDIEDLGNGEYLFSAFGSCAWSCSGCMLDIHDKDNRSKAISLPDACEELSVECELISEECGCAFTEHFHITKDGILDVDDSFDYQEVWIEECDTFEEFVKEYYPEDEPPITKEQFDKAKEEEESHITISNAPYFDGVGFEFQYL